MVRIAVIGGTGLDDPTFMSNLKVLPAPFETPYGLTSDYMVEGTVNGVEVILIARHGRKHRAPPSSVNYRANIFAICSSDILGCGAIVATNAVGSLRNDLHRVGDLVIVDQFIDFTSHGGGIRGPHTFYDAIPGHLEGVVHCPMADAFSKPLRSILVAAGRQEGAITHDGGTCVVVEGPRFSSRAEHRMFAEWGGDIINMTMVPEVCLAAEMGMPYASIALVTDLDIGADSSFVLSGAPNNNNCAINGRGNENMTNGNEIHTAEEEADREGVVSHKAVLENMKIFAPFAARTIARALPEIAKLDLKKMHNPPMVF